MNALRVNRTVKGGKNNGTQVYHGSGVSSSSRSHNYPTSSNIVSLNLAYNNISMIEQSFFQTVETVLKVCIICHKDLRQGNNLEHQDIISYFSYLFLQNILIIDSKYFK